ncbi:hypothetical protein NHH73_02630 [Oxalobacteraceae bacterium OTU3CINTB1]|nr:hypothetical protein NHH73_02630 [Oxalobacteraceae bacterium OTU3CINTB1]
MNQHNSDEKLDPQDPERMRMQPPIPTHPPDPIQNDDVDKVVASNTPGQDLNDPALVSTGIGAGAPIDEVGGAGLGRPPGGGNDNGGEETPATERDRDVRAVDQQDRTGQT